MTKRESLKNNVDRAYRLALPVVWVVLLAVVLMGGHDAWANNPDCGGPGCECFNDNGLPGTYDSKMVCQDDPDADDVCTSDPDYQVDLEAQGIISTVINDVTAVTNQIYSNIIINILSDSGFIGAAKAAMVLYVICYAVSFMLGMVQLTLYELFIRMVKLAVVSTLLDGSVTGLLSKTFIHFFNDGTTALINKVSTMVTGGTNLGGDPFSFMDDAIITMTSLKMFVTIIAMFTTGPFGWVIVFLLGVAAWSFIKAMMNAVWIYLFTLVMRTVLLGVAPLFLACVMFSRTRHLFDGWLSQIVNSCLQPIFLFAFFSFFIQLIYIGFQQLNGFVVCWTAIISSEGGPTNEFWWRFAPGGIPYDTPWTLSDPPPVPIMLAITLWLLSDLGNRGNQIVIQIAKDMASASTSYDFRGEGFGGKATGGGNPGATGGGTKKNAPPNVPRAAVNHGDVAARNAPEAASRAEAVRARAAQLAAGKAGRDARKPK